MEVLLQEYREVLKKTRKEKEIADELDQKVYTGIITDLEVAIKFMETGRPPGRLKGIYGASPSEAFRLDSDQLDYLHYKKGFPIPLDPFEEVENRIDKERSVKKRA